MSKTIKIIDLLVRMHKKENLPRKIQISGEEYLYDNISETYVSTLNNQYLGHEILLDFCLNDKVVIIEEQEEINIQELEEIKEMEVFLSVDTRQTLEENLKKIDEHEVNFFFKINEIIRKQNKMVQYLEQLDKNIKEKQ